MLTVYFASCPDTEPICPGGEGRFEFEPPPRRPLEDQFPANLPSFRKFNSVKSRANSIVSSQTDAIKGREHVECKLRAEMKKWRSTRLWNSLFLSRPNCNFPSRRDHRRTYNRISLSQAIRSYSLRSRMRTSKVLSAQELRGNVTLLKTK